MTIKNIMIELALNDEGYMYCKKYFEQTQKHGNNHYQARSKHRKLKNKVNRDYDCQIFEYQRWQR